MTSKRIGMRKLLIILGLIAFNNVFAQEAWEDIIYLKNGGVTRGTITSGLMEKTISITSVDGQKRSYSLEEIEKFSRERSNEKNSRGNREEKTGHHQQSMRVGLSFAPGFMTKQNQTNFYLAGDLEYYLSTRISVVSTIYYFLNSDMSKSVMDSLNKGGIGTILKMNHQNFTGFRYHLLNGKRLDPFIGFQPGFSICQTSTNYYDWNFADPIDQIKRRDTRISFDPIISFDLGFNIYAVKYFHLFMNGRYTMGRHLGGLQPYTLNEFSLSFGLGLNASFRNNKKAK